MSKSTNIMQAVVVVEYEKKYQRAFELLNKEWIERYFTIEPADEYLLTQPEATILQPGGAILMALHEDIAIGTVGLRKLKDGTLELIKMAVHEQFRGKGIGELLGKAALEKAAAMGIEKVVLYSNTSLAPALSLYKKLGFVEVPLEPDNEYTRSDIKMEILTGSVPGGKEKDRHE